MSRKILIATSTSESKITYTIKILSSYLQQTGLSDIRFEGANVYTMNLQEIAPDLIVLIGPNNFDTSVPVIDGSSFLTKIDAMMNGTCEKIFHALQSMQ